MHYFILALGLTFLAGKYTVTLGIDDSWLLGIWPELAERGRGRANFGGVVDSRGWLKKEVSQEERQEHCREVPTHSAVNAGSIRARVAEEACGTGCSRMPRGESQRAGRHPGREIVSLNRLLCARLLRTV